MFQNCLKCFKIVKNVLFIRPQPVKGNEHKVSGELGERSPRSCHHHPCWVSSLNGWLVQG